MTHVQQTNDHPKPFIRLKISSTPFTLIFFPKFLRTTSSSSSHLLYSMRTSFPTPPSPSFWRKTEASVLHQPSSVKLTSRRRMEFISRRVCITFYPRLLHAQSCGRTRIASSASEDRLTANLDRGWPHKDKGWRAPPTATLQLNRHPITSGDISRDLPS